MNLSPKFSFCVCWKRTNMTLAWVAFVFFLLLSFDGVTHTCRHRETNRRTNDACVLYLFRFIRYTTMCLSWSTLRLCRAHCTGTLINNNKIIIRSSMELFVVYCWICSTRMGVLLLLNIIRWQMESSVVIECVKKYVWRNSNSIYYCRFRLRCKARNIKRAFRLWIFFAIPNSKSRMIDANRMFYFSTR